MSPCVGEKWQGLEWIPYAWSQGRGELVQNGCVTENVPLCMMEIHGVYFLLRKFH